jgi:hypothetical protein
MNVPRKIYVSWFGMKQEITAGQTQKRTFRALIRNVTSIAGIVGPVFLALTTVIATALHQNYSWFRETVSQLGNGPHGWIENTGFITFGLLMIVFAEALFAGFRIRKSLIAAILVWTFIGLGFVIMCIFHADISSLHVTIYGEIHTQTAHLLGVFFPLVCFLLLPGFESDPHFDSLATYTLITGGIFLVAIVPRLLLPDRLFESWSGIFERALMLNALAWLEIVAIKLLSHRRDPVT